MDRMDNDALRERVTTALLSDGPLHPDLAVSRVLAALGLDDPEAAAERIARHLHALGFGYDIDADPVARDSMLAVARGALEAALTAASTEVS